LVAALLSQVIADVRSDQAHLRADARAWLHDLDQVTFWTSLAGIDPDAFLARVQPYLG